MEYKTSKRIIAYVIDFLIIILMIGVLVSMKEKDPKVIQQKKELGIVNELYVNHEIVFSEYFDQWTVINQQIDQECVIYFIFNILLIMIYFVALPYVWNGQTIGKKVMKIKVCSHSGKKITIVQYLIRNMVFNGLAQLILTLLFLYLLSSNMYFIFSSILTFIQLILVMVSISMILYRRDKRSLHDILSGTEIIQVS